MMERRAFLNVAAAASVGAAAAAGLEGAEADPRDQAPKKYGVRITVLKRGFEKEFVDQLKTGPQGPCTRFADGQAFTITSQWAPPEKFCDWAWADIRTYVPMVLGQGNQIAVCCTDGFRPVFFKLERVEL